jgi:ankyrin repeat protein
MTAQDFVSHSVVESVLADDTELIQAIGKSRRTLPEFRRAFEKREIRQVDFLVTLVERRADRLLPVGLLVERIHGDIFEGREVPNALVASPGKRISCNSDQVIDWRYMDAFECVGGSLYRLIYHRQPWTVQTRVGENQPFLLEWYKHDGLRNEIVMDTEYRDLFRDIVNLRYAEVERKLKSDRTLHQKEGYLPRPGGALRARLFKTTVSEQAVMYGDTRMVRLLGDLGVLHADKKKESLLPIAAWSRNLETTRCLLELGFDVNAVDEVDQTALEHAIDQDCADIVALLLKYRADVNRQNCSRSTPLFLARSAGVARTLLDAGARVDAIDDEGKTAAQYLLENGRADVVAELVKHGAKMKAEWRLGLNEEQIRARGKQVLREHFEKTDPNALDDFELSQSIDYGCVLPVRFLTIESQ